MNISLQKTGSKVNGLEQSFHHRRVHCHLFHIPDGLENLRENTVIMKSHSGGSPPNIGRRILHEGIA